MKNEPYCIKSPIELPLIFTLLFMLLFFSCEKDSISQETMDSILLNSSKNSIHEDKTNSFYGPAIPIGKGVAKSFVVMSHSGVPKAIGIKVSAKSLDNLPIHEVNWTLQLPNKMEGLPFDHIDFGWNPMGHEPEGIYDLPHFDIHFYMISEANKSNILDPVKAEMLPALPYWPETYFPTDGFVPMMGKHWLSGLADEIQPEGRFTQTFIYGSYEGNFIFYEPMITLEYLNQMSNAEYPIYQPSTFQNLGLYYPNSYRISYDSTKKEYTIVLEHLELAE